MNWIGEAFGYLAGFSTAVCFLPQTIKTLKSKDVRGLSVLSYCIYVLGMTSWTAYGIYLRSIPMIVFNSMSGVFAIMILYTILTQQGKNNEKN